MVMGPDLRLVPSEDAKAFGELVTRQDLKLLQWAKLLHLGCLSLGTGGKLPHRKCSQASLQLYSVFFQDQKTAQGAEVSQAKV